MAETKKETKVKAKTEDKKAVAAYISPETQALIVRPLITEKSTREMEQLGKYTFEIARHATKRMVQGAVERMFNVKVVKVNVMARHGKMRRVRNRAGWTKKTKRAIVTLEQGQKIKILEGV